MTHAWKHFLVALAVIAVTITAPGLQGDFAQPAPPAPPPAQPPPAPRAPAPPPPAAQPGAKSPGPPAAQPSTQAPAQKPPGCDPQEYGKPKEVKNQDDIDKLEKRVQIVCNAMKSLGVMTNDPAKPLDRDRGLKVDCQLSDPLNCNLSGYVGRVLQLRWDRAPGIKGFKVYAWVPEQGAEKYRDSREEVIKKEQANQSSPYSLVWDMWKPTPDALLDTSRSQYGKKPHEDHQVPYGEASGEMIVCDIKASIYAEMLGKDQIKSYSQFYGKEIVDEEKTKAASLAMHTQLQQEVKAMLQSFYQAILPAAQCKAVEEVAVPELPLVIPAADLGGDYKAELTATKGQVVQQLAAAKKEVKFCGQTAVEQATVKPIKDSVRALIDWAKANEPTLDAEQKARLAAENFFKLLPRHYHLMTDAERTKVEQGLLDRALALRRYRTVQRGIIREKTGFADPTSPTLVAAELIAYCKELDEYYTALSRMTWAGLELEALARMAGPINAARTGLYGTADVAELAEKNPDPRMIKPIEDARRRLFDALIEMGIISVLASEMRLETTLDARKDRLYGVKEMWTGEKHPDPNIEKALRENLGPGWKSLDVITSTVNALGFGLLDVLAGMGADAIRAPIYGLTSWLNAPWAGNFKSRAQKLEQQRWDNWEKMQWRILALRQLKLKSSADVQKLAQQILGRDMNPKEVAGMIAAAIGKIEAATIMDLIEDRTFAEATDGGFYRILGSMIVDFRERGRMEMSVAREKTRLMRRDMESALRVVEGRDPDTGDLTWGTIISPTAWADITLKSQEDPKMRGAAINEKAQQMLEMFKLEPALYKVDFNFGELPPELGEVHKKLVGNSVPYIEFVQKVDQERRARYLHSWLRAMPDVLAEAALFLKKHYDILNREYAITEARNEVRRTAPLVLRDYLYAADLPGALSYTKYMKDGGCDGECAKTYAGIHRMLLEAYAGDRFNTKVISFLRPLGDLGFFSYGISKVSLLAGAAARQIATLRGIPVAPAAPAVAAAAEEGTALQYLYESVNPFATRVTTVDVLTGQATTASMMEWSHAVRTVMVQSLTEVIVGDMLVPAAGHEYEPLLMQPVMLALSKTLHNPQGKKFKNMDKLLERAIVTEKAQNGERYDANRVLAELMGRPVLQAELHKLQLQERMEQAREPAVRESLDRQARADQQVRGSWVRLQQVAEAMAKIRESLKSAKQATYENMRTAGRAVEDLLLPPTIERYEALLQTRAGELFDYEKGLDIQRLRDHIKAMRGWTRPENRPRLAAVEAMIDQQRMNRFMQAMQEFLSAHAGSLVGGGVILNGTRAGNPEYKGVLSDLDFTVVTKPGVDQAAIRSALDTIFAKQHIVLNAEGKMPSADIEGMVQDFLPGEVRPIKTWKEFEQWALTLPKDPHRYLSGGGAEWVGGYNFLNGDTVSLAGGKAVIDRTPNPELIPKPEVEPMNAHGLVLDQMRFDTYAPISSIPDAGTMGEMIGDRAKVTLRYVDAIIMAKYPDLVRMRAREGAQQKGYHGLLVEDVQRLVTEGILTQQDFQIIQRLYEIKTGKTVFQTMKVTNERDVQASRGALEFIWQGMDEIGKKAYKLTREAYLGQLENDAKGLGDNPKAPEVLMTLAFRIWNAAQKVNAKEPQKMAQISGDPEANPKALKLRDQQIIGVTLGVDPAVLDKFEPRPVSDSGFPVDGTDPRWFRRGGERAPEGAESVVSPTVLRAAALPVIKAADPRSETVAKALEPLPNTTYLRGEGGAYADGKQVGVVKDRFNEPYQKPNDVVAYKFGRWTDVNIAYAERGTRRTDGEIITISRWIEGQGNNGEAVRAGLKGQNTAGKALVLNVPLDQHKIRLRDEYIGTRLIAALLGDLGGEHAVTGDGHVLGTGFDKAQPFDASLARKDIAEQTQNRFKGEPSSSEAVGTDRFRKLDQELGVKYEDIAKVWASMKAKMLDAKGNLNEQQLEKLAEYYGEKKREVLETWKHRIRLLDTALGRVFLPEGRVAALGMNEATLRGADRKVQEQLFQAAKWMRVAQESMVQGILAEQNLSPDAAYAILKRDSFEAFLAGVLEKMHRKKYDAVSEMDDMARGRINLPTGADVKRVVQALEQQGLFTIVNKKNPGKAEGPKEREGIEMGYPRYHAILLDERTGFTFEWQIGTKRTTDFFEIPGIELGNLKLKEGMQPNIHDIEYDIFKYLQESDIESNKKLAQELGVPEYRKRVAEYAAKTFEGSSIPEADFRKSLAEFHKEASDILAKLISRTSVEFVQGFFH